MIGGTLGRYFAKRFLETILAVFAGVFVLIYAIDLVEMLRRSGDTPGATGLLMAWDRFCIRRSSPSRRCHSRCYSVR